MQYLKRMLIYLLGFIGVLLIVFIALCFVPIQETVSPIQARPSTQYWKMEEGYKIAYTKITNADSIKKSPIIYLHGGPGGYIHSSIIKTMSQLRDQNRDIYLYDQIGSGLSDRLDKPNDYGLYRHVNDLEEIISRQIKTDKVILIGQSFGGMMAAHFIAQHPNKIEKLILTAPGDLEPSPEDENGWVNITKKYPAPDSLHFIDPPAYSDMVDKSILKPRIMMSFFLAHFFNIKFASDREMDAVLNTMATKFMPSMVCDVNNILPEEGGGGTYAYMGTNFYIGILNIRPQIQSIETPVLVMQGQCDQLPYAFSYEYVDLFPNSKYQFIENAGHDIWLDQEEVYLNTLRNFIANY